MGRRENTAAASRCRDGAPRDFRLATPHAKGTPSCPLSQYGYFDPNFGLFSICLNTFWSSLNKDLRVGLR